MENSKIEWTDRTFNPIAKATGGFYCIKISPACKHCYAETMARRIAAMQGGEHHDYKVLPEVPSLVLKEGMLEGWAKKRDAKKNFVSSMTDIFGEFVPDEWVFKILDAMAAAPRQIFQTLTKRDKRSHDLVHKWLKMRGLKILPPNIWFGMSTEDQKHFSERVLWLINIPAHTRFISCEPLLSDIKMWPYLNLTLEGRSNTNGSAIDWVIIGGESGNKKTIRPMQASWAQSIRDQCLQFKVPFFFKQWGEYLPESQFTEMHKQSILPNNYNAIQGFYKLGKHNTGNLLDGQTFKQFPNN